LKEAVTPLAYVLLANPIRQEAKETFTYFAEQGVEVKVISGDNPLTVSEVAKEAGSQAQNDMWMRPRFIRKRRCGQQS